MARQPSKPRNTAIRADRYQYTAVFDPDGKGGHTATVPALPGGSVILIDEEKKRRQLGGRRCRGSDINH